VGAALALARKRGTAGTAAPEVEPEIRAESRA
jgi:hypothetical protein